MALFQKGDVLEDFNGEKITIEKFIAGGGQGDVYVVDYKGEKKALKWHRNLGTNPKMLYKNLQKDASDGAPSKSFLWPIAVTKITNHTFGYIMDLRPNEFYELSDFILAKVTFPSFKAAVEACLQVISGFRILHNRGFSYQDLNDGNFFINPKTGDVLICDNDNVAPNGTNTGIIGKPRYMAPEIVEGCGNRLPDTQSDRFSLAIILFVILFNGHPLEGQRWADIPCMTTENAQYLYGNGATFIFDTADRSNRAIRGSDPETRWNLMPQYIKDSFLKSFSKDGIKDPNKRLRETDWLKVFTKFRSGIIKCPYCGNEIFVNNPSQPCLCDKCHKQVAIPHTLILPSSEIVAAPGNIVYRCQLEACNDENALDRILIVASKNGNPNQLGIINVTNAPLDAINSKGENKQIMPLTPIPFIKGIVIKAFDQKIILK